MKLINKLFGFSTKNLYLGELKTYKESYKGGGIYRYRLYSFDTPKYILGKKWGLYSLREIFNHSIYNTKGSSFVESGDIIVDDLVPIITTEKRISYKDAEEILKTKNCYYMKK